MLLTINTNRYCLCFLKTKNKGDLSLKWHKIIDYKYEYLFFCTWWLSGYEGIGLLNECKTFLFYSIFYILYSPCLKPFFVCCLCCHTVRPYPLVTFVIFVYMLVLKVNAIFLTVIFYPHIKYSVHCDFVGHYHYFSIIFIYLGEFLLSYPVSII